MTHPLGWPERPRAGSQWDTVLLEMDVRDAQVIVDALREGDKFSLIANYVEIQIDVANRLAEKRMKAAPPKHRYMGFDA